MSAYKSARRIARSACATIIVNQFLWLATCQVDKALAALGWN